MRGCVPPWQRGKEASGGNARSTLAEGGHALPHASIPLGCWDPSTPPLFSHISWPSTPCCGCLLSSAKGFGNEKLKNGEKRVQW